LQTLRHGQFISYQVLYVIPGIHTCAVLGGKYSNDHQTLSVLVAVSIFLVIFITTEYVSDMKQS
jgi:hypothetical protein